MTLKEYNTICGKLEDFCIYASRRAPYGEPELLKRAAALEAVLLQEYNAKGDNLAIDCVELSGNPARADLVARYRKRFEVSGKISALVDNLRSGKVACPEKTKGELILALKGLHSLVLSLSRVCALEFDKMDPGGKTVPELIKSTPRAFAITQAVAAYLTEDYKPKEKLTRRESGLIGREIGRALGHGYIHTVGQYWGMSGKELSREGGKAELDCNPKIIELKELLRGVGVKI